MPPHGVKFQFLLVRLKGQRLLPDGKEKIAISIPSGAIKSYEKIFVCGDTDQFQFLLVRLKAFGGNGVYKSPYGFQFLLVRLKELSLPNFVGWRPNFNSFWCD